MKISELVIHKRPIDKTTTQCARCGSFRFRVDRDRNCMCDLCGGPFSVTSEDQIANMACVTVELNEEEPIIGPEITALLERKPKESD